jgi:16S rRNA (cytidine1402-2'-O)-methyltransferase
MTLDQKIKGKIYLVATPIGNLGDFSFRAVAVLKTVDIAAAEDTRRTKILLEHYGISKKIFCLREHNEAAAAEGLVALALEGKSVAYLSDAGTPLISDPGLILVKKALAAGVAVEAIPGTAAFLPALILSGLSTEKFKFCGFLPAKRPLRLAALDEVDDETATLVFYEAPHRIKETLADILGILGNRQMAVCRELTKKFEEVRRGSVSEILAYFQKSAPRGELVLVLEGARPAEKAETSLEITFENLTRELLRLKIPEKNILSIFKNIFKTPRNQTYRMILKIKKSLTS